jgi:predicted nucleic acid-binding protein
MASQTLVMDASIVLAWVFPDERSDYAEHVIQTAAVVQTFVPFHWELEIANALVFAFRRKRITLKVRSDLLSDIGALECTKDLLGVERVWPEVVRIADGTGLTVYDALYLELALRTGSRLACLDKAMFRAASDLGIAVLSDAP